MASPVLRSHGAFKENSTYVQPQQPGYGQAVPQQGYGQVAPGQQGYAQPGAPVHPGAYGQPGPANPYGQPNSPDQLQQMYQSPAATPLDTGRMTYHHVIARTSALLGIIIAVGAV